MRIKRKPVFLCCLIIFCICFVLCSSVIIVIALLVSDEEQQPVASRMFQRNCKRSCWFNIRPEITTQNQIETFIKSNNFLLGVHDSLANFPASYSDYEGYYENSDNQISIIVWHDTVASVRLVGLFDLTLFDILYNISIPDFMFSNIEWNFITRQNEAIFKLFYPDLGYILTIESIP